MNLQLSPTDSLLSAPGDNFATLFPDSTNTSDGLLDPMDMMTPKSFVDDKTSDGLTPIDDLDDPIDTTDKKPAKKRKSWGQVLPEPKTNLPPRKRAKTADEKEQRRVERVLRNRRAAQSSRERKRLEVEALEKRNQELETLLLDAQKANLILVEQLNHFRRDSGVVTRSPTSLDSLCDNQLSLSPELFSSQDGHQPDAKHTDKDLVAQELLLDPASTVDPVAFSPELSPISEVKTESLTTEQIETHLPDLAQHPAEVLSDLQCHTSAKMAQSFQSSQTTMSLLLAWTIQARMLLLSALTMASVCQRPLTQIALSWQAGFPLLPTPQLLTTIIWLVTRSPCSQINQLSPLTLASSSSMRQATPPPTLPQPAILSLRTATLASHSTSLRLKSLRKILASSPSLARPLMDATMVALRLVSERGDDQLGDLLGQCRETRSEACELTRCLDGIDLPSKEALLTLLWALALEVRRNQDRNGNTRAGGLVRGSKRDSSLKYMIKVDRISQIRRRSSILTH